MSVPVARSISRPCASTSVCRKRARSVLRPSRYPSSGVAAACAAAILTSATAQARAQKYLRRPRKVFSAVAAAPGNPSLLRRPGRQHIARAIGLQRAHEPRLLHAFQQPRGAVVADLQPPLHVRYGGLALGRHDPHRLVVQRILLGILAAAAALALALLPRQSGDRAFRSGQHFLGSSGAAGSSALPPRGALPGRIRTRRARAWGARCPGADTAYRRARAASPPPSGREWCASRPAPKPGRRCGRGYSP